MPQYPQPTDWPDWTTGQASQVSAPTPALQASGFTSGQRPAFQTINWLYWKLGAWVRYFSQGLSAVMTGASQEPGYRLLGGGNWSWNATSGVLSWSDTFAVSMPGLADAANTAAAGSVTLTAGQVAYVQSNAPFTTTGNVTAGSAQVTNLAYESGISVGETVSGPGIPAGTTVLSLSQSDTSLTLSAPATATSSGANLVFATSGPLTVQAALVQNFSPAANTVVIARCFASNGPNQVHVGVNAGQMLLRDLESKPLLSNGYVTTQRITAGPSLAAASSVYVSTGGPDVMTYIRSGGSTQNVFLYSDAVNGITVPASQLAIGDTLASAGGTSTVTAVNGAGNLAVSPPLVFVNEGNSPYPATSITITRQSGKLYLTDTSNSVPSLRGKALGIVPSATAGNTVAHVVTAGTVNNFPGLSAGYTYYATPGTPGGLTLVQPTAQGQTSVPVGTALSSTSLLLNAAAACQAVVLPNGYKSVIDMGFFYNTNTSAAGLQSTLDSLYATTGSAVMVHKHIFTHPGSVVGLSAHLNNTVAPITTIYLGKSTGVLCSINVPSGANDWNGAFTKGAFPFVAGDPLFAYVYFAGQTNINCALRVYATVEFTP